jgi:seryl-tRNA synthetase
MVRRGLPKSHISECVRVDSEVRADISALASAKNDRSQIQKEVKAKKKNGEDVDETTIAKLKVREWGE